MSEHETPHHNNPAWPGPWPGPWRWTPPAVVVGEIHNIQRSMENVYAPYGDVASPAARGTWRSCRRSRVTAQTPLRTLSRLPSGPGTGNSCHDRGRQRSLDCRPYGRSGASLGDAAHAGNDRDGRQYAAGGSDSRTRRRCSGRARDCLRCGCHRRLRWPRWSKTSSGRKPPIAPQSPRPARRKPRPHHREPRPRLAPPRPQRPRRGRQS